MTIFLDWVYLAQRHFGADLPIVGDGVRVRGESFEQMEVDGNQYIVVTPRAEGVIYSFGSKQAKGSHDTSMRVRCDGSEVQLSGNIGRWERPNNVWNYGLEDSIESASKFVSGFDLPAFTAGDEVPCHTVSERDLNLGLLSTWTGGLFREMHVTQNYETGGLAKEVLRHFSGQRAARLSKGIYGAETVQFGHLARKGKPLHKAIVCYIKADEMLAHAKGQEAKRNVRASAEYQHARDTGLIRIECKWGAHMLRDNGLRFIGDTNLAKVINLFNKETSFLLDAKPDQVARVVAEMPQKIRSAALHWIRGDDLELLYSRTTRYRLTKQLRDYGIDASESRARSSSGVDDLQAILDAMPSYDLRPAAVPDWYDLPCLRVAV